MMMVRPAGFSHLARTRLLMKPAAPESDVQMLETLRTAHRQMRSEIGKIIIGQEKVLDELLMAFFCLATQNPIEQEGTYPLPEAQQDRFLFMIKVDYPSDDEEEQIMRQGTSDVQPTISKVLHGEDILKLQHIVRRVPVADHVFHYAKQITRMSRPGTPEAPDFVNKWLTWGAGPRASMNLILAAKAHAVLNGKQHVSADDVAAVAAPILRHRLIPNFTAQSEGVSPDDVVQKILQAVPKNQAA